jgi:hypothetical protein
MYTEDRAGFQCKMGVGSIAHPYLEMVVEIFHSLVYTVGKGRFGLAAFCILSSFKSYELLCRNKK